jgi:mRNA-degrading endonuclease RelE of RelBE toxin-antitoxin system
VTWRIIWAEDAQRDLDRLPTDDRDALLDALFGWVDNGPPPSAVRLVAGARLLEYQLAGIDVMYFASEADSYVAVIRLRRH